MLSFIDIKLKIKLRDHTFLWLLTILLSGATGYYISGSRYSAPRNCAEIAKLYLEMGRYYYGIDSNNQDKWSDLIERETHIQNYCLEQFPNQYPWNHK